MTDSPHRGLSTTGKPDRSTHPTPSNTTPGSHPNPSFLRHEQHAPSDVGVKDLRPLRGRPTGRSLTPTP